MADAEGLETCSSSLSVCVRWCGLVNPVVSDFDLPCCAPFVGRVTFFLCNFSRRSSCVIVSCGLCCVRVSWGFQIKLNKASFLILPSCKIKAGITHCDCCLSARGSPAAAVCMSVLSSFPSIRTDFKTPKLPCDFITVHTSQNVDVGRVHKDDISLFSHVVLYLVFLVDPRAARWCQQQTKYMIHHVAHHWKCGKLQYNIRQW